MFGKIKIELMDGRLMFFNDALVDVEDETIGWLKAIDRDGSILGMFNPREVRYWLVERSTAV